MRRAALAIAALLVGCGGTTESAPQRSAQAAPGPITPQDIKQHLDALEDIARRSGGNRVASGSGERLTVEYIQERLRSAGWRVRTQDVKWPVFELRGRPRLAQLRYRSDFNELEYTGSIDRTLRPRPIDTQACDAAALGELTKDDLAIVARGTCTFRRKALNAQQAGAGGLVVVDRDSERPTQATLADPGIDIPVLSASRDAGAALARTQEPVPVAVDSTSEERTTQNVIAETAPARRVVMAGAHVDSVKEGPGANDNASGIAALLEIAERLGDRPGLRLGFWTAEENGLWGSRHYVGRLSRAQRRRLSVYVNLDMVGTKEGGTRVYDTDDRIERVLRAALPGREGETDLGQDSDHAPFDGAGIRIGGIFTGLDGCYHRRCDTASRTSATKAARNARATQRALVKLSGG